MGTLLINSVPASVLFDSGASHSFMSEAFAFTHGIKYEKMHTPLVVKTTGAQCHVDMMAHNVTVENEELKFLVSPIIYKSSIIDLILRMD